MKKIAQVGLTMLIVGTAVLHAAVIFEDNFENEGTSVKKWTATNNFIAGTYKSGELEIKNSDTIASGSMIHTLSPAPETFTFSASMKFGTATEYAGFAVCFQTATYKSYSIFITKDQSVVIFIPGEQYGRVKSAPSVSTTNANVVTVSKKGSEFNVFVNNEYITSFTDAQFSSGSIALNLRPKSTVIYDNVVLEDTFRAAQVQSKLTDDFEDGVQNRWAVENSHGTVTESNGKLNLSTTSDSSAYIYAIGNLGLGDDFTVKTEVSMVGGDSNTIYGITIRGDENNQFAIFAINGDSKYGTLVGNGTFSMYGPSSDILGKPFKSSSNTYYYIDTIEIAQSKATGKITFSANGVKLTEIPKMNFAITSVGVFCRNNVQIQVDNLYAENKGFTSVLKPVSGKMNPVGSILLSNANVFDVLGRTAIRNAMNSHVKNSMSNGIYFTQGQRGRVVLTNR